MCVLNELDRRERQCGRERRGELVAMTMVNEVVFFNLREAMLSRLDRAVDVVAKGHRHDAVSCARRELPRLVAGLRALIALHTPDADGYCGECRGGRWWRRQHSPCRVLLAYYIAAKEFDDQPEAVAAKHRLPEQVPT